MRNLLLLFTQKVYICFVGDIYQQIHGALMGSRLGPFLAGIFIVDLDTKIIATVAERISNMCR